MTLRIDLIAIATKSNVLKHMKATQWIGAVFERSTRSVQVGL